MTERLLPLEFADVSYRVGSRTLIDQLSFSLSSGEPTLILGPNGAGKSLTLRLAHGLLQPTTGSVAWRGSATTGLRRRQAMVFQRPVLLKRSVASNVDYALRVQGVPREQRELRCARALENTGLTGLADQRARSLSAGEQQRLAIARAWSTEPEVLFLDEPTASLDPAATGSVEKLITAIFQSGTKIVMTTHDLGQARRLAGDVLFLHRGRLMESAASDAFFQRPESSEARAFLNGELFW